MKDMSPKIASQIRRQHNHDLIRKMRNGESLTSFDSKASWYPPRPTIEKDQREIARVYQSPSHDFHNSGAQNDEAQRLRVLNPEGK